MTHKDNLRHILIAYKHGHYDLEKALKAIKNQWDPLYYFLGGLSLGGILINLLNILL